MSDLIARLEAAKKLIGKLASSRCNDWRMSIPPRDDDTDIFLVGVLTDSIAALQERTAAEAKRMAEELFEEMALIADDDKCVAMLAAALAVQPSAVDVDLNEAVKSMPLADESAIILRNEHDRKAFFHKILRESGMRLVAIQPEPVIPQEKFDEGFSRAMAILNANKPEPASKGDDARLEELLAELVGAARRPDTQTLRGIMRVKADLRAYVARLRNRRHKPPATEKAGGEV